MQCEFYSRFRPVNSKTKEAFVYEYIDSSLRPYLINQLVLEVPISGTVQYVSVLSEMARGD